MLDQLTCHSFSALINSTFRITNGAAEILEARLLKATPLAGHSKGAANGREAFLLWFHVPGAEGWRQKIYALDHGALGRLDVFLVPIKQENGGLVFEAVFN